MTTHQSAQGTPAKRPPRVRRVSQFILDSLLILPIGCLTAILWANTFPESYFRFANAFAFPVNEVGIAFFFALVTKEVVEATLPGGALHPWRRAGLPMAAAVGGAIVPILIYRVFLWYVEEPQLQEAWVVTCAVDVGVCYLIGGLIFGRHPAFPFLLLMAIASNAIGLTGLAILHPIGTVHLAIGAGLMTAAIGLAFGLRKNKVMPFWPYVLGSGTLSWGALFLGGLHPALALVPIVPFLPHAARDAGLFVEPSPQARDTLSQFERWWRFPVQGVLLLFGLVNSGVPFHGNEVGLLALPVATMVGRPIGVLVATYAAIGLGLHRTAHISWRELLVMGCTASVGLVVALFFSAAALPTGPLLLQMKMGALVTGAGAALAFAMAWVLGVGRMGRKKAPPA